MGKNIALLLASLGSCGAILWFASTLLASRQGESLPDYGELVAYDPARAGGHLRPDVDALVQGARHGRPVRWVTNAAGFRNRGPIAPRAEAGAVRILFYGDSFVDGMRTDQTETIGAVLERRLAAQLGRSVEVVISGHNNPANAFYHWQRHGHQLRPDVVLIGLTVGNDLTSHNFGAGVRPVAPDGPRGRAPGPEALLTLVPGYSAAGVADGALRIPDDGFLPPEERSPWTLRWAHLRETLAHRLPFLQHSARPLMGPEPGRPGVAGAAGYFTALGLFYRGELPFIASVRMDLSLLLRGFAAQVRHFGARPLLVAFPTRIEVRPADWARLVRALELDPERFDRRRFEDWLPGPCARAALPCLYLGEALRTADAARPVFRPRGDMHLNEHGQAVAAAALEPFVIRALAAPPAPGPGAGWPTEWRADVRRWARAVVALRAPWFVPGEPIVLAPGDGATPPDAVLRAGWHRSGPDRPYWSSGPVALIDVPVAEPGRALVLELEVRPFLAEPNGFRQRVGVFVAGQELATRVFKEARFAPWRMRVPARFVRAPFTRVGLTFPDSLVPAEHGISPARRQLGLAVRRVSLAFE